MDEMYSMASTLRRAYHQAFGADTDSRLFLYQVSRRRPGNISKINTAHHTIFVFVYLKPFQCIGEGGQGGVLRIDFSSDGEWIRAEARGKDGELAAAPVVTILLSASSGEVCEDKTVRECPSAAVERTEVFSLGYCL